MPEAGFPKVEREPSTDEQQRNNPACQGPPPNLPKKRRVKSKGKGKGKGVVGTKTGAKMVEPNVPVLMAASKRKTLTVRHSPLDSRLGKLGIPTAVVQSAMMHI